MPASQLFLIIISGLGVIHGLFLAIFLWAYPKGNRLANRLLATLLIVLSFRVGKSVFLEFLENLDAKFIFIGLGTMMAIGPLFYLYARASIDRSFVWTRKLWLHFVPCIFAILFGFWIHEEDMEALPIMFFVFLFFSYYGHFLFYLIWTRLYVSKQRKIGLSDKTYQLMLWLFYGLLIVWLAYFTNLFDDLIPYIVGPILYSLVAYVVSFVVISRGYLDEANQDKYKTTRISDEQMEILFSRVQRAVVDEKQYKNPALTLKSLSASLHVSTQVLSMVINQMSQKNFNAYVNHYRVEEAIGLFKEPENNHLTISAIAYAVGFNSLSSFNSAFKKQTKLTPLAYRNQLTE
ncbi:helix-turn-helix domain-containing protein [Reichenbachiella ulvae]|uniref:AraC family transcriptional regulator n=1 Tax=Reichenbachiella ulvae TaxID=2980104 RepID=A0ABT3CUG3_9BACT|nr:AraC family transcriptional regulator [Reichenbachiella ulvae]MCV9387318.1 AraC family transcriptional regulator [Reichenbachiella ulvae]